jgi:hypothetical protein
MVERGGQAGTVGAEAAQRLRELQSRHRRWAKADRLRQRNAAAKTSLDWQEPHSPGMILVPVAETGAEAVQVLQSIEAMALAERSLKPPSRGQPGVKRQRRTRDIVSMLEMRGAINLIHVRAAHALRGDAETAVGARQPRESTRGVSKAELCFIDVQICCAARLREAKAAIEAVGPLAWPVVRAVVLEAQSLTDLAGSRRSRDTGPWMAALVEGLMAAARVYKMV